MKKVILVFLILFLASCTTTTETVEDWTTVELTDIRTGQTFSIEQYQGTPILLESFAVWCPSCTNQQQNTKEFHEMVGDEVISISLDTDPNEDETTVHDHILEHDFDWLYAIAPTEMTNALIDEFGLTVVSAPSIPIILICEDQEQKTLLTGTKSAEELQEAISDFCTQ
tara:strand:- start:315 stop:821 length:507 start_codon:yes stop_codon:yes gene_type:complete